MDVDQSIVIGEAQKRLNYAFKNGHRTGVPDPLDIEDEIIRDASIIPASIRDEIATKIPENLQARINAAEETRSSIAQAWGDPLIKLAKLLALAEYIHGRFSDTIFSTGYSVLAAKEEQPDPEAVTGALLKCILTFCLYGKSCAIATEIEAHLIEGYPESAASRLRTLYEHIVILTIIRNDHTYEISERYQDHAVFERLQELRVELRIANDPMFHFPDGFLESVTTEIAEATRIADRARSKWGTDIAQQYEWVRPAMKKDKNKRRILFADLEAIVDSDFLRGDYLKGNSSIHAGAYTAINHFSPRDPILRTRPRRDDYDIRRIGGRTATFLGWAALTASKSISWETEEYDEYLYAFELERAAQSVANAFWDFELVNTPCP